MKIIITEKQLQEVLGVNLAYLGSKDGGTQNLMHDKEIGTTSKMDDDIATPTIGDKIAKSRTPRSYFGARKRHAPVNCDIERKNAIITETNQDLENKQYPIPSELLNILKKNASNSNAQNTNGKKRLNNLISMGSVSTGELYRLRNHFNKINKNSDEYNLLGGEKMLRWIEQQLKTATNVSRNAKEVKKRMGFDNAFIKKHNKSNSGTAHSKKNGITFSYED